MGPVHRCACGRVGADNGTSHRGPGRLHTDPLQAVWCVGLSRWVLLLMRKTRKKNRLDLRKSNYYGEHELGVYFTNNETRHTDITNEVMGTVGFPPNNTQGLRQHEALLWKETRGFYLTTALAGFTAVFVQAPVLPLLPTFLQNTHI